MRWPALWTACGPVGAPGIPPQHNGGRGPHAWPLSLLFAGQKANVLEAAIDIPVDEGELGEPERTRSPLGTQPRLTANLAARLTWLSALRGSTHAQTPCNLESVPLLCWPAHAAARPWLRAYLPSLQPPQGYNSLTDAVAGDSADGEDSEDAGAGRQGASAGPAAGAQAAAAARGGVGGGLRGEHLFRPPGGVVRLLGLVAVRALRDGEELLQARRGGGHACMAARNAPCLWTSHSPSPAGCDAVVPRLDSRPCPPRGPCRPRPPTQDYRMNPAVARPAW
jgi:hypothetical protein